MANQIGSEIGDVASKARENIEQAGGGVAEKAREGVEHVKEKAFQRMDRAKELTTSGKNKVSDRVQRVGTAIRSASERLREEDELVGRYADRVSDQIQRVANYVRNVEPRQAISDVEAFARREPALFLGGAFLLGLSAARFLKGSSAGFRGSSEEASPEAATFVEAEEGGFTYG